ncbi:RNase H domain-containing protein [Caerostris extrusa]|uniref:RNase H domain-containing protein n=1 Tax=Caerostris extrusa TaxID=172846 RepID=A0AAV4PXL0_CAEEX|nr:RNase H domain-containing protein [Caerostris extrusa]
MSSTTLNSWCVLKEVINNIPSQALVIYTEGSKSNLDRTGSGVFTKAENGDFRYNFRNPDNCPIFRSKLLAIRETLNFALSSEAKAFEF